MTIEELQKSGILFFVPADPSRSAMALAPYDLGHPSSNTLGIRMDDPLHPEVNVFDDTAALVGTCPISGTPMFQLTETGSVEDVVAEWQLFRERHGHSATELLDDGGGYFNEARSMPAQLPRLAGIAHGLLLMQYCQLYGHFPNSAPEMLEKLGMAPYSLQLIEPSHPLTSEDQGLKVEINRVARVFRETLKGDLPATDTLHVRVAFNPVKGSAEAIPIVDPLEIASLPGTFEPFFCGVWAGPSFQQP